MNVRDLVEALQAFPDQDAPIVIMTFDPDFGEWQLHELGVGAAQPMFIRPYTAGGLLEWCGDRAKDAVKALGIWVR